MAQTFMQFSLEKVINDLDRQNVIAYLGTQDCDELHIVWVLDDDRLHIYDQGGEANEDALIRFLEGLIDATTYSAPNIVVEIAFTCSRPFVDSFRGAVAVVRREQDTLWIDPRKVWDLVNEGLIKEDLFK